MTHAQALAIQRTQAAVVRAEFDEACDQFRATVRRITALLPLPLTASALRPILVLLVDVDVDLPKLIERALEDGGYAAVIVTADSPESVVVILGDVEPDVVLVDPYAPAFTDQDLVAAVQNAAPGIPCVLLTRIPMEAIADLSAGVVGIAPKDQLAKLPPIIDRVVKKV